ncbi:MAG TPA: copper resistance protein CopC [Rhizomicrobium sp.]|jgi:methionine-rich copper-binding protein CopC|nr:copper resistance protein CopC [Rhizomicrobium sp.]
MKTRIALSLFFAATLATPAFAHAFLQHAVPGAGQTLAAPKEISLTLSEKLEPSLSGASVMDAAGHEVSGLSATVKDSMITVALPPLKPGLYHVTWHAVSVDSHRTEGGYTFTVTP